MATAAHGPPAHGRPAAGPMPGPPTGFSGGRLQPLHGRASSARRARDACPCGPRRCAAPRARKLLRAIASGLRPFARRTPGFSRKSPIMHETHNRISKRHWISKFAFSTMCAFFDRWRFHVFAIAVPVRRAVHSVVPARGRSRPLGQLSAASRSRRAVSRLAVALDRDAQAPETHPDRRRADRAGQRHRRALRGLSRAAQRGRAARARAACATTRT